MIIWYMIGVILFVVLVLFLGLFVQYRKHKKPLLAIDPNVHYSLTHHVKMVTLPTLRYRFSSMFAKKKPAIPAAPKDDAQTTPPSPTGDTADQQ